MPFEPTDRLPIAGTGLQVTRLGFGSASIGGLFKAVSDVDAVATVERAWELGIRMFDVAPLYGYGAAERRLGMGLAGRPRDDYVLSTKVGRLVRSIDAIGPGADIDGQELDGRMRSTPAPRRSAWSSTIRPTACDGPSRRVSSGSASTASTSP